MAVRLDAKPDASGWHTFGRPSTKGTCAEPHLRSVQTGPELKWADHPFLMGSSENSSPLSVFHLEMPIHGDPTV
jgi:hypothetical protein